MEGEEEEDQVNCNTTVHVARQSISKGGMDGESDHSAKGKP